MNRMHVISIPYSLMKVNPLSWIQKVHTYKGEEGSIRDFCNFLLLLCLLHLSHIKGDSVQGETT